MIVDSITINGADTVFHLNRIVKSLDTLQSTYYRINAPEFFGARVIQTDSNSWILRIVGLKYGEYYIFIIDSFNNVYNYYPNQAFPNYMESTYTFYNGFKKINFREKQGLSIIDVGNKDSLYFAYHPSDISPDLYEFEQSHRFYFNVVEGIGLGDYELFEFEHSNDIELIAVHLKNKGFGSFNAHISIDEANHSLLTLALNPCIDFLQVKSDDLSGIEISIIDLLGQEIKSFTTMTNTPIRLDVSIGVYHVFISDNNGKLLTVQKLIVNQ